MTDRGNSEGPMKAGRAALVGAALGTLVAAMAVVFLPRDPVPAPTVRAAVSCETSFSADADERLRVSAPDAELPQALRQELARNAAFAQAQWRSWLGDEDLPAGPIDVVFIADPERFAGLYRGPDIDGWTTTGFYRIRSHEAVILWAEPWRDQAMATALHELSHLLTAWHLGPTPAWLNEGLAEHFETVAQVERAGHFRTAGHSDSAGDGGGRFRSSESHRSALQRHGPVDLDTLLGLSRRDFGTADTARRYASAWSLVAFLLDSDSGSSTFRQLLREAHAGRCETATELAPLLATYPGGLEALERDWQRWIFDLSEARGVDTAP